MDPDPAASKLQSVIFFYFLKLTANIFISFEGVSSLTKEIYEKTGNFFKKSVNFFYDTKNLHLIRIQI